MREDFLEISERKQRELSIASNRRRNVKREKVKNDHVMENFVIVYRSSPILYVQLSRAIAIGSRGALMTHQSLSNNSVPRITVSLCAGLHSIVRLEEFIQRIRRIPILIEISRRLSPSARKLSSIEILPRS